MPATSPRAIQRRQAVTRARMRIYRQHYPDKATATIRACYWRKRVRKLREALAAAEAKAHHWAERVEAMRWR